MTIDREELARIYFIQQGCSPMEAFFQSDRFIIEAERQRGKDLAEAERQNQEKCPHEREWINEGICAHCGKDMPATEPCQHLWISYGGYNPYCHHCRIPKPDCEAKEVKAEPRKPKVAKKIIPPQPNCLGCLGTGVIKLIDNAGYKKCGCTEDTAEGREILPDPKETV